MKSAHLIGLTASLLFSAATLAADTPSDRFEALDQDQNGQLSATEASQDKQLSEKWTEVDADESGTIDRVEFSAFETLEAKEMKEQPMKEETQQ